MSLRTKRVDDIITLMASAIKTATSAGEAAQRLPGRLRAVQFVLDVSATATDATDTLNVFVQTRVNKDTASELWLDVAHFTEVIGTDTTKQFVAKITGDLAQAEYETGTTLGAAAVRNILGDEYRIRFVIVNAGTGGNVSFTFSVTAMPVIE